jgi:hypothetical protein
MAQESTKSVSRIEPKSIRIGSHHPATTESRTQPACPPAHTQEQSPGSQQPADSAGERLLATLWRSTDSYHQLGILDRQSNKFRNLPVTDVTDAITQELKLSSEGAEVYFAPAEYQSLDNRTAANASGAYGNICDADLNNFGALVNLSDYSIFRGLFGAPIPLSQIAEHGDLNGDGHDYLDGRNLPLSRHSICAIWLPL